MSAFLGRIEKPERNALLALFKRIEKGGADPIKCGVSIVRAPGHPLINRFWANEIAGIVEATGSNGWAYAERVTRKLVGPSIVVLMCFHLPTDDQRIIYVEPNGIRFARL